MAGFPVSVKKTLCDLTQNLCNLTRSYNHANLAMKSCTKLNPNVAGTQIPYAHGMTELQEAPHSPMLSTVGIRAFRVPWEPLKSAVATDSSCAASKLLKEPAESLSVTERPGEEPTESVAASAEQSLMPFEVVLEQIRQRHETKTTILEEALQRSERFQDRFWGINE